MRKLYKYKFGDLIRPVEWTPALRAVVIAATENGVEVVFDPAEIGEVGKRFHFVNECVELAEGEP